MEEMIKFFKTDRVFQTMKQENKVLGKYTYAVPFMVEMT